VGTRLNQRHTAKHLLDNSPTNQLTISQDADWSTRRQRFITERLQYIFTLNLNCTLTLTLSTI